MEGDEQKPTLRKRLIAGYQANFAFDKALAEEWFPIDAENWPEYDQKTENREGSNKRNHQVKD